MRDAGCGKCDNNIAHSSLLPQQTVSQPASSPALSHAANVKMSISLHFMRMGIILWRTDGRCAVASLIIYWNPTLQLWIASLGWLADTLNSSGHDMKTLSETQTRLNRNVWLRDCEWVSGQYRPDKITSISYFVQAKGFALLTNSSQVVKMTTKRMILFQENEFFFDFWMQLISHFLLVWLTANISEHPGRPASARDQSRDPATPPSDMGK